MVGWQGYTLRVPDDWDMIGFSGTDTDGYFRVDDGAVMAIEVKWATEKKPLPLLPFLAAKGEIPIPDVSVRRESYFKVLRDTAKKKKLTVTTKDTDPPRGTMRPERTTVGFTWTGDRKGVGAIWYCSHCNRVTIVQVLGDVSGKGGLGSVAEKIFASLECHDKEPGKRVWAIYDLVTVVPTEYLLAKPQLMNVYLRLPFTKGTARLSVEQWAVANVARKDSYMDLWVGANSKGELSEARYSVSQTTVNGKDAVSYSGGPAFGQPMIQVIKEATQLMRPATRFSAVAWEDTTANKIYLVEIMRPAKDEDPVLGIAARTGSPATEAAE